MAFALKRAEHIFDAVPINGDNLLDFCWLSYEGHMQARGLPRSFTYAMLHLPCTLLGWHTPAEGTPRVAVCLQP